MILLNKDGGLVDAALSLTPHIEPVDDYTGFSAIVTDLQARRKVEKAQQMARDLELVDQLAHEINNPLQAIVNCMTLLATTGSNEHLHYVDENLTRIANVITRLVAVSRK